MLRSAPAVRREEDRALAALPLILDTDGGVDDCTALWYALTDPAIDLLAVTVVRGVVDVAQAARNVAKVLHAASRAGVPIAVGDDEPYGDAPDLAFRAGMHGGDGLGDAGPPDVAFEPVREPAHELLARLTAERAGEIVVAAVGPFTNVARAVEADAAFPRRVGALVAMGGAARPPGNTTALGEFNAVFDPWATAAMVGARWPASPLLVGLDVTRRAVLTADDVALAREGRTPAADFLAGPLAYYFDRTAAVNPAGGSPSHDTLAVMAAAHPEVVSAEELPLSVDVGGSAAWGTTVVDFRVGLYRDGSLPPDERDAAVAGLFADAARWRIALDLDVDAFQARVRRMLGA